MFNTALEWWSSVAWDQIYRQAMRSFLLVSSRSCFEGWPCLGPSLHCVACVWPGTLLPLACYISILAGPQTCPVTQLPCSQTTKPSAACLGAMGLCRLRGCVAAHSTQLPLPLPSPSRPLVPNSLQSNINKIFGCRSLSPFVCVCVCGEHLVVKAFQSTGNIHWLELHI